LSKLFEFCLRQQTTFQTLNHRMDKSKSFFFHSSCILFMARIRLTQLPNKHCCQIIQSCAHQSTSSYSINCNFQNEDDDYQQLTDTIVFEGQL